MGQPSQQIKFGIVKFVETREVFLVKFKRQEKLFWWYFLRDSFMVVFAERQEKLFWQYLFGVKRLFHVGTKAFLAVFVGSQETLSWWYLTREKKCFSCSLLTDKRSFFDGICWVTRDSFMEVFDKRKEMLFLQIIGRQKKLFWWYL